jgi:hypothetical protein
MEGTFIERPLFVSNDTSEAKQRMCRTKSMSRKAQKCEKQESQYDAGWFRTDGDDDPSTTFRQVSKCRLYLRGVKPSFLSVLEGLCAS